MAEVIKLVQATAGGTDKELDLKDGTNFETKEVFLTTPPDIELWHRPDYGESELVDTQPSDRPCQLDMMIFGSSAVDEDGLQNNIVELRRWLKTASRMATSIYPVYLVLQKNLATNAVQHKIKSGHVDDSVSHYIAERHQGKVQAINVAANLVLAPYGAWTSTITLQNDMFSSPHFVEDTDADGLADGWNHSGTPTTVIQRNTRWLFGGASQKVTTDNNSAEGINSDTVTCNDNDEIAGYVWIRSSAGADDVRITLILPAGTVVDTVTHVHASPTGYDKSIPNTSGGGGTWYRYAVSDDGTGPRAAANCKLRIQRNAGDASAITSFFLDGAYLEVGTTTVPDAWMSARNIDNRGDIQSGSQANENLLNYIDVWGIPGDASAFIDFSMTPRSASTLEQKVFHLGTLVDSDYIAANRVHWIEADDFSVAVEAGGNGAWSTGAGTTNNQYRRFTEGATNNGGYTYISIAYRADYDVYQILEPPRRLYAICRSNSLDPKIQATTVKSVLTSYPYEHIQGEARSVRNVNTWELLDLGLLNMSGAGRSDTTAFSAVPIFELSNMADGNTFDLDALLLMPTEAGYLVFKSGDDVAANTAIITEGEKQRIYFNDSRGYYEQKLGGLWTIAAGSLMTRVIFIKAWDVDEYEFARDMEFALTVTPRTRHLLGT